MLSILALIATVSSAVAAQIPVVASVVALGAAVAAAKEKDLDEEKEN